MHGEGSDERFYHVSGLPSATFSRKPVLVQQAESMTPPNTPPGLQCPLYIRTHGPALHLLPSPDLTRQEGKMVWPKAAPPRARLKWARDSSPATIC